MITQRLADALKSALAHLDRAIEIAECNDPENAYVTDLARDDVRAALAAHEAEKAGAGNYRTALEDIVNPIAAMRRQLELGCSLNGAMAVVLSESAEYLKQIAKDALAAAPAQPPAPEPQGVVDTHVRNAMQEIETIWNVVLPYVTCFEAQGQLFHSKARLNAAIAALQQPSPEPQGVVGGIVRDLEKVRACIATTEVDCLGVNPGNHRTPPWPIRDEVLDGLSRSIRLLSAIAALQQPKPVTLREVTTEDAQEFNKAYMKADTGTYVGDKFVALCAILPHGIPVIGSEGGGA